MCSLFSSNLFHVVFFYFIPSVTQRETRQDMADMTMEVEKRKEFLFFSLAEKAEHIFVFLIQWGNGKKEARKKCHGKKEVLKLIIVWNAN